MSGPTFYTADEARRALNIGRELVDGACSTGALKAADAATPGSTKRRWRILDADLIDWQQRGFPRTPETGKP